MSAPLQARCGRSAGRRWLATAVAAAGLLLASSAPAATITSLTAAFLPGNSTDEQVETTSTTRVRTRTLEVLASDATSFATRYAMLVGTDSGQIAPASSLTESFTASYEITLGIQAPVGEVWQLILSASRLGALTIVNDGNGSASATLGALTSAATGGTLSGSLDLAAVGTTSNAGAATTSLDTPFDQTAAAILSGVGTGAVQTITLSFTWTASTTSTRQGNNSDEAAVRMGHASTVASFTAGDYPGLGARTQALDGHFVSATLIPEPGTALLCSIGLGGLAWSSRRRTPARA